MAEKTIIRHLKIAGQPFVLRNSDVLRAVRKVDPEPITSHFVVVGARRLSRTLGSRSGSATG